MGIKKQQCLDTLAVLTREFEHKLQSRPRLSSSLAIDLAKIILEILHTTRDFFELQNNNFIFPIEASISNIIAHENSNRQPGFFANLMRNDYLGQILDDKGCLFALISGLPAENSPRDRLIISLKKYIADLTVLLNSQSTINHSQTADYLSPESTPAEPCFS